MSPLKFRELFLENYSKTIMSWRNAWWNTKFCKRANLQLLKEEFHLANDPWFVMKREDAKKSIAYSNVNAHIFKTICSGDVANESVFAIMLHTFNELQNVKSCVTHATDWSRMTSATSPHVFKEGNTVDMKFITTSTETNRYAMFLRKVDKCFPDNKLLEFIYKKDENELKRRSKVAMLERKLFFLSLFNKIVINFKRYGHFLVVLPFIIFFLRLNSSFRLF
jgi:hypothetical protein